jgi:hypothetical protein
LFEKDPVSLLAVIQKDRAAEKLLEQARKKWGREPLLETFGRSSLCSHVYHAPPLAF